MPQVNIIENVLFLIQQIKYNYIINYIMRNKLFLISSFIPSTLLISYLNYKFINKNDLIVNKDLNNERINWNVFNPRI